VEATSPSKRIRVHCRPGQESDTPAVLELTGLIWEGHDYVPEIWAEWLADPEGRLLVAEYQGKVVGLGKLSHLSAEDWWLQGLRVHPEFEGRGVASQLHEALMQAWQEIGQGTVRLATASFRLPVQHLCEKMGFRKVGEFTPFAAPTNLDENLSNAQPSNPASMVENDFTPLRMEDLAEALAFAQASESLALNYGHIDMAWEFVPLRMEYLARFSEQGQAWWWRDRQGLLAVFEDQDNQGTIALMPQFVACSLAALSECLLDFRQLAAAQGFSKAAWMAALNPTLAPALTAAGFRRDWEHAMFLYEKSYPTEV
jgi:GNAT superfamily N-acetyltransferase